MKNVNEILETYRNKYVEIEVQLSKTKKKCFTGK